MGRVFQVRSRSMRDRQTTTPVMMRLHIIAAESECGAAGAAEGRRCMRRATGGRTAHEWFGSPGHMGASTGWYSGGVLRLQGWSRVISDFRFYKCGATCGGWRWTSPWRSLLEAVGAEGVQWRLDCLSTAPSAQIGRGVVAVGKCECGDRVAGRRSVGTSVVV